MRVQEEEESRACLVTVTGAAAQAGEEKRVGWHKETADAGGQHSAKSAAGCLPLPSSLLKQTTTDAPKASSILVGHFRTIFSVIHTHR